jgi:pSer/pThr/pTyr-binding forkhead associated (FHA) protein
MIEVRGPEVVLIDLGATNGTWVGGKRADEVEISNQDEFTVGSTTLMLIVTGGPSA